MKYTVRNAILPVYYQIGYHSLTNGLSVGDAAPLDFQPISALHYHHCLEFGICCGGTGEMHIENRIYRFSPGDISYVGANVPHFSKADADSESKWVWIFLDPMQQAIGREETLNAELSALVDAGYNGVFHPQEYPRLSELILRLKNDLTTDAYTGLEIAFLTGEILIEAARIGNVDKSKVKLKLSDKLKPALIFIRNNYMNAQLMTEGTIAANCGLSVSQFRKLFRQDVGIPLPQYINNTRMSSAVYLLCNTDKQILNVALESGFENVSYFNKQFRKAFGITPKQMRKNPRNRNAAEKENESSS